MKKFLTWGDFEEENRRLSQLQPLPDDAYQTEETARSTIEAELAALAPEDQIAARKALARYEKEATNESYKAEPFELLGLIQDLNLFEGSKEVVDLGAGPGDLIKWLSIIYPEIRIRGIELSPAFVARFNAKKLFNATMQTGLIDRPLTVDLVNDASVISALTLDRVTNPKVLIQNMAKFNKAKILATLLPIVPEDDNPSLQSDGVKNIYTRPENRIVPGKTMKEDRDALFRLLKKTWKETPEFVNVGYPVTSSGDRQEYELGVFFTS